MALYKCCIIIIIMVLYKALVRSHLEHAVNVWNPHHQILIEKLEKVQKRATKLVTAVKHFKYEERLKQLNLPTIKYRRIMGDVIEVYKIFSGKFSFTKRIISAWNSLPDYVVNFQQTP